MLGKRIEEHNANVYLINTGWSGGPYGVGSRIKLPYTRAMVSAALNGELEKAEFVLPKDLRQTVFTVGYVRTEQREIYRLYIAKKRQVRRRYTQQTLLKERL